MAQRMGALDETVNRFFASACLRFETALELEPYKQIALDWAETLELEARMLEEHQQQLGLEMDVERINQLRALARQKREEAEHLESI